MAVSLDGRCETIARGQPQPSGLGGLPDGRLLIVSMLARRLMRLEPDGLQVPAELLSDHSMGTAGLWNRIYPR
ncbi:MAG: hypothetical protein GKR94_30915 [Gammaproteobacteria bacterium]|nr:hypothetical protein [Gammaproteobacteria bacterium]